MKYSGYKTDHPIFGLMFAETSDPDMLRAISEALVAPRSSQSTDLLPMLRKAGGGIRNGLDSAGETYPPRDEVDVLRKTGIPLAILQGSQGQTTRLDYLRSLPVRNLWREGIREIPDAGHCAPWEQHEPYNAMLSEFLSDIVNS
ncbi:hypothetical protein GF324_01470 [bacterium]|nr:hypothetical protein [bacterium]